MGAMIGQWWEPYCLRRTFQSELTVKLPTDHRLWFKPQRKKMHVEERKPTEWH